jgi:cytochrome c oxidase subunit 4
MDTAHSESTHGKSKFHTFVQLAMYLAIITGLEIVIIFLPFSGSLIFTSLVVLSVIKFLAVIFWFMHLIYDRVLCTIIFFIGLALGGGTMAALLALFSTDRSEASAETETTLNQTVVETAVLI